MEQIEIKSQSLKELKETVAALGEKPFRAKQLYEWIHQKLAVDFEEMTNLSKAFREKLKQQCVLTALETLEVQTDRKSTRLNSSHSQQSRMPSSA